MDYCLLWQELYLECGCKKDVKRRHLFFCSIKNNGKIVENRLYQETSKDGTRYLGILMNDLNINARPYRYYYKEENN